MLTCLASGFAPLLSLGLLSVLFFELTETEINVDFPLKIFRLVVLLLLLLEVEVLLFTVLHGLIIDKLVDSWPLPVFEAASHLFITVLIVFLFV